MSKAEEFIENYTRNCSNEISEVNNTIFGKMKVVNGYQPWLTPDQARRAVEIAREEMLDKVCEWIGKQKELLEDSFSDPNDFADILKKEIKL